MGYKVRLIIRGKAYTGTRVYKTLAGAKKSINSPSGKRFTKSVRATRTFPVKIRKK